jgi:very-short-patch-repair endonuclease
VRRKWIFNVSGLNPRRKKLRRDATQAEKILWERLRNKQTGVRFFRQYSVEGYVIDFYCPEKKLAVEIEGGIHKRLKVYDDYRFRLIRAYKIRVLRFSNEEVFVDIGKVVEKIRGLCNSPFAPS